jgi:hypothetical protein
MTYRVGRRLGRTIYRMAGDRPSDQDQLIGTMDTPELGALVVGALNAQERMTMVVRSVTARSCQDANGEACPPDRCKIDGPHYVDHSQVDPPGLPTLGQWARERDCASHPEVTT